MKRLASAIFDLICAKLIPPLIVKLLAIDGCAYCARAIGVNDGRGIGAFGVGVRTGIRISPTEGMEFVTKTRDGVGDGV